MKKKRADYKISLQRASVGKLDSALVLSGFPRIFLRRERLLF